MRNLTYPSAGLAFLAAIFTICLLVACNSEPASTATDVVEEEETPHVVSDPFEPGSVKYDVRVPSYFNYSGELLRNVRWTDGNGENMLVVTTQPAPQIDATYRSTKLFVYHFCQRDKKVISYHTITETLDSCMCDCDYQLFGDTLFVADVNEDKVAEAWFMYGRNDRCDVSLLSSRLRMLSGESQLTIDGYTELWTAGGSMPDNSPSHSLMEGNTITNQQLINAANAAWDQYEAENTGPE